MSPWSFATAADIRFGAGVAREAVAAARAAGPRALVVTGRDAGRAAWLIEGVAGHGVAVETVAVPGEPDVALIEAGVARARAFAPDCVIGIGGGSALDAAKAIAGLAREPGAVLDHLEVVGKGLALTTDPPLLIAIPTTAGTGSEVTRNAVIGVPEAGRKVSLRDRRIIPALALVDPALTLGLPRAVTAATGLDALTQVIEPFVSPMATPFTDALCRDAIPRGARALPLVLEAPDDLAARTEMAWVSLCGGIALANAKLGAVHGLSGVIGGTTGAAHGAICGRLLVPVLRANEAALLERAPGDDPGRVRFRELRALLGTAFGVAPEEAFDALGALVDAAGVPDLAGLGLAGGVPIDAMAEASRVSSSMKGNPIPLRATELATIMRGDPV